MWQNSSESHTSKVVTVSHSGELAQNYESMHKPPPLKIEQLLILANGSLTWDPDKCLWHSSFTAAAGQLDGAGGRRGLSEWSLKKSGGSHSTMLNWDWYGLILWVKQIHSGLVFTGVMRRDSAWVLMGSCMWPNHVERHTSNTSSGMMTDLPQRCKSLLALQLTVSLVSISLMGTGCQKIYFHIRQSPLTCSLADIWI